MGVPKFFRWISERYPNLSVIIENNQIPVFDCLYLDMNGIIHVCSHPDDTDVQFRITEEQIFSNVFKYIDFLFKTVKPKEVFFLAVDGVAPRAKMNQQRGRRFKSAKEAKDRDAAAIINGVVLPKEKRFDSNAITPGTEFMDRLQQALRMFLAEKVVSDSLWQGVTIILSGHETPGEGEHKIQEFIRYCRSQPGYNPNRRHCLYGLDADLMLLSLASHEPYFSLLREEVVFSPKGKARRAYIAEETTFFLLHLSLLRDYIDYEFSALKSTLGPEYDLERVIDDWIVLSFFVGNDFVPNLPNIHIHTTALPLLWQTYIDVRPRMHGYINEHGTLHLGNLLLYVKELAKFDKKHFREMFEETKWHNSSGQRRSVSDYEQQGSAEKNLIDFEVSDNEDDIGDMANGVADEMGGDEEDVVDHDDDNSREAQFLAHKAEYYRAKLGLVPTADVLQSQARAYFTALQWISYYYFCGVPSWGWFYAQHYAPFVSDLVSLGREGERRAITFELGRPFLPFEQLMAVLPADSAELLPDCYSVLMTMPNSPIIDFYPRTFKLDLNGKKQEWESLVLVPFIDEARLLGALASHQRLLTAGETRRNVHAPHTEYNYRHNQLTVVDIEPALFRLPRDALVFGLCPGVRLDVICQGFPSLRHVAHTFSREKIFVRVFEHHSAFESVVLTVTPSEQPPTVESVARTFLGKLAYVNWPVMLLVKIVAVLHRGKRVSLDWVTRQLVVTTMGEEEAKRLTEYVDAQPHELFKRRAIALDQTDMIVLETLHSEGRVYEMVSPHKDDCRVALSHNWIKAKTHWHLHQLSVLQEVIDVMPVDDGESRTCTKFSQLFPVDGLVFCLDKAHYGLSGRVKSINGCKGSVFVRIDSLTEPDYREVNVDDTGVEYMTASQASEFLDIDATLFSKITGSIYIPMTRQSDAPKMKQTAAKKDRYSIGLDLKNNKLNLQVPGWVVKADDENGIAKWLYSIKVVRVLDDYRDHFPQVFEFIRRPNFESLSMEDVFDIEDDVELLNMQFDELRRYLNNLEYKSVERLSNEFQLLSESQIGTLEQFIDNRREHVCTVRTESHTEVDLKFKELYRPHHSIEGTRPDMSTEYKLLDRVVCSTGSYTVPLGLRGVVIGIEPMSNDQVRLEVLFDDTFKSAISLRGSQPRCYRMPSHTLINTSHGVRKFNCPLRTVKRVPPENLMTSFSNIAPLKTPFSSMDITQRKNDKVEDVSPLMAPFSSKNIPQRKNDKIENVDPPVTTLSLGSNLLAALFSTSSIGLPPMPSKQYIENVSVKKAVNIAISKHCNGVSERQSILDKVLNLNKEMNLLVDCDDLFEATVVPSRTFTKEIDATNYPKEYTSLFKMCVECGVSDPVVVERHVDDDIFMSFRCADLEMPEVLETNLVQGRINHVNRVWYCLYSRQQQHQRSHEPPQSPSGTLLGFSAPPIHEIAPSNGLLLGFSAPPIREIAASNDLLLGFSAPTFRISVPSNDLLLGFSMSRNITPSNSDCVNTAKSTVLDGPKKPFIRAPKSKITFPA